MEFWNQALIQGQEVQLSQLAKIGYLQTMTELESLDAAQRIADLKASAFLPDLTGLVAQAITVLWNENPLKPYAILAAEEEYTQYGNSRCDVRVKQPDGRQIIFDYKVKFGEVESKWIEKNMEQYASGEQRYTYTTAAGVDLFGIIMVLLKPTIAKKLQPPRIVIGGPWPVTDHQKTTWLRDARLMTPLMDATLTVPHAGLVVGRPYPHGNSFGPCVYEKACMDYALDESKMLLDYIQIERIF